MPRILESLDEEGIHPGLGMSNTTLLHLLHNDPMDLRNLHDGDERARDRDRGREREKQGGTPRSLFSPAPPPLDVGEDHPPIPLLDGYRNNKEKESYSD